jgi:hypothetical protein
MNHFTAILPRLTVAPPAANGFVSHFWHESENQYSARHWPCVGDFVCVGLPDLVCPERGNRDRLAIQRHELDFESLAFAMHQHDSADVSGRKFVLRQIAREHHFVKFENHFDD